MQLFLQFYADSFELIQVFCHGLKMCICVLYNLQLYFCPSSPDVNLEFFSAFSAINVLSMSIYRQYLVSTNTPTVLYNSL